MEPRSDKKQVVFNFRDEDSEHNDVSRKGTSNLENSSNNNSKSNTENIFNLSSKSVDDKFIDDENNDRKSEDDNPLKKHITSIDGYDRLNITRQSIKRKTRKNKTEFIPKNNLKIERFNSEITKITEDLSNFKLKDNDVKFDNDSNNNKNENKSNSNSNTNTNTFNLEYDKDKRNSNKKKTIRFDNKRVTFQYPKEIEVMKFGSNNNDNISSSTNDNEIDLEKSCDDKKENSVDNSENNHKGTNNNNEKETSQFGFNEEEN